MVDYETITFIDMINELAEKTKKGFIPYKHLIGINRLIDDHGYINTPSLSEVALDGYQGIVYDNTHQETPDHKYPIIHNWLESLIPGPVETYTEEFKKKKINIYAIVEPSEDPYIEITFDEKPELQIIVENGKWHTVC